MEGTEGTGKGRTISPELGRRILRENLGVLAGHARNLMNQIDAGSSADELVASAVAIRSIADLLVTQATLMKTGSELVGGD